jgi:citrate lyase subunit beta/citryl-CoA lyase
VEQRAAERDSLANRGAIAPLFVPGDRPDRVRKARERGAQVVVIDLEDAVPPDQKATARELTVEALNDAAPDVCHLVRVNPVTEPALLTADLEALAPVLGRIDGIVVPKVQSAAEVVRIDEFLGQEQGGVRTTPLIATIENAVGVREVWAIAAASTNLYTLLFGVLDLAADLGIVATPDGVELLHARSAVVLACAAAGLAKPIDGPHLTIGDRDGLEISTRHARRLGFGGKIVIHPDQLATVISGFAPTPSEVDWAARVVAAFDQAVSAGVGVVRLEDGTFVDAPVAAQARTLLRGLPVSQDGS